MNRRISTFIVLVLILAFLLSIPMAFLVASSHLLTPAPKPAPILTPRGTPPAVGATAAYLLDADTGRMLADINGQQRLPMASTTKIMTAVVALEKGNVNEIVTIQPDAVEEVKMNDGSSAQLVAGDQIRLKDLLYGLMLPSGDDAAIAIADAVGGSKDTFVKMMNDEAHLLHLNQTHYINPDGLTSTLPNGKPNPNHYTTAADLAHLTRYALSNSLFAQIVQLQSYSIPATSTHHAYTWITTDNLLAEYAGATGVKTGFTGEAGYCLVFSATNGKHHLIGVLLNEKVEDQRFTDAAKLLDWGFNLPLLPPPPPSS
ncbi:MAG TPA: serine hydrolase [Ktedonobacteraceae bacterium]